MQDSLELGLRKSTSHPQAKSLFPWAVDLVLGLRMMERGDRVQKGAHCSGSKNPGALGWPADTRTF